MAAGFLVLAVAGWVAMVLAAWRVMRMLSGWQPTVADVWKSDYTESDQWQDRWSLGNDMLTTRGFNWRDGEDERLITDEIVYTTSNGQQHRALVERQVWRGRRPDSVYTVWYDEADPDRVTPRGPGYWALVALAGAAVMVAAIYNLAMFGGLPAALAQLRVLLH